MPAERLRRVRSRAHFACSTPAGPGLGCDTLACEPSSSPIPAWTEQPDGRRRTPRVAVNGEASLRRRGSFSFQLALGDLSAGGCKVELVESVEIDDRVIARLPGLEAFSARVAWADRYSAGIAFDRAIHPAVFEQLVSRLG